MEHEDKSSAPLTPPDTAGGRPRVVSAAATEGGASSRSAEDLEEESDAGSSASEASDKPPRNRTRPKKGPGSHPNNVRRLRIERLMSKAELARRANVSVLTMDRVEKGYGCRMDTKRKILEALGLTPGDRVRVFGEED